MRSETISLMEMKMPGGNTAPRTNPGRRKRRPYLSAGHYSRPRSYSGDIFKGAWLMRSETISLMKMKIPGGNVGPGLAPAATRLPERTPGAASDAPTYRLATNRGPGPTVATFSREAGPIAPRIP